MSLIITFVPREFGGGRWGGGGGGGGGGVVVVAGGMAFAPLSDVEEPVASFTTEVFA